jgi:hypothetical protein
MRSQVVQIAVTVELQPGEKLALPTEIVESIGAGRWLITLQPAPTENGLRDHSAFLKSYGPEDEGLYDDVERG